MLKTASKLVSADQIITPVTLADDLTLSTGNLVIGTSGKGIDFSATPGTGTSELLDDYEEGTWTPEISAFTNPTLTYTSQIGQYTKIGDVVYCRLYLDFDITVGGIGALISSLPFAAANLSTAYQHSLMGYEASTNVEPTKMGGVEFGTATMRLYRDIAATTTSASVTGTRAFYIQFFYFAG